MAVVVWSVAGSCNGRILFDPNGCDKDDECPLANLYCEVGSGTCVACTSDTHCALLGLGLNRCDTAAHRCVECGTDSDCALHQTCHASVCVTPCSGEGANVNCPSETPHCEADLGFCIACEEDNHACSLASASGSICNRSVGRCVSCLSDANCGVANPRCDTVTGRCTECLAAADCGAAKPICDPARMVCVPRP